MKKYNYRLLPEENPAGKLMAKAGLVYIILMSGFLIQILC